MTELDKVLKDEANELAQEVAFSLDRVAGVNGGFLINSRR